MIGIRSGGIWRIPHLSALLGAPVRQLWCWSRDAAGLDAVAGWGQRPASRKARAFAARHRVPYLCLEDGFLRSCGLGVRGAPPLSLVLDDVGIYYDATRPSRLELLIAAPADDPAQAAQARRALQLMRAHRLSKYNHAPAPALPARGAGAARVLVVDQTHGDVSVRLGGAGQAQFDQLLAAALAENPHAEVWIKTHPDVLTGKKRSYLGAPAPHPRVRVLARDASPLCLIEQMDKVYVVTSQMGFEALIMGKPVVCFGQPWYAGWGLTDDRHAAMASLRARRPAPRTLEQLFAAAYLRYTRYLDPASGAPGTIFDVIDWLARNKAANDAARGTTYCVGMSLWKRTVARPFLAGPSCRARFVRSVAALQDRALGPDSRILIWGVQNEAAARALAQRRGVPLWRMEDGFLRSAGLGSELSRPVSLVLDAGGIYYDPGSDSALQAALAAQQLTAAELARAARLRQAFVAMRISKYNLGRTPLRVAAQGRPVLLVPGQVEDDASIVRGSPLVRSNLALLQTVRAANPRAYILYKAHPDVLAGNRRGAVAPADLAALADQCVNEANIIDCILAADEVHTMTSLSGFEALLHGRAVHCYGGPFYAGWGLTHDHMDLPRRQRALALDALVYAVMLEYPRYVLPGRPGFVSAETVMDWLARQAAQPTALDPGWLARKGRHARALLQLLRAEWQAMAR